MRSKWICKLLASAACMLSIGSAFMLFATNAKATGQMIELAPVLSQGTLKYDMNGDGVYEIQFYADDFVHIKSEITSLNEYVNTNIGDVNTTLSELSASVDSRFTTVNGRLDTLDTGLSTLSSDVDTRFSSVNTSITTINGRLNGLDSSVLTINNRLNGLDSSVSTINTNISTLNTNMTTLQSQVTSGKRAVALALRGKGATSRFNPSGNLASNGKVPAFSDLEAGVNDVYSSGLAAGKSFYADSGVTRFYASADANDDCYLRYTNATGHDLILIAVDHAAGANQTESVSGGAVQSSYKIYLPNGGSFLFEQDSRHGAYDDDEGDGTYDVFVLGPYSSYTDAREDRHTSCQKDITFR